MAEPTDELPAAAEPNAPRDAFRLALPQFEGPLDLLLHLIREHKIDILDIPIALVTQKYLEHLEKMREIDLDIAGEFLVMAATLLQLKSRLLLPKEEIAASPEGETAEQGPDPRQELVRRLLEYQKYRDAAEQLARADLLDRDTFTRKVSVDRVPLDPEEIGLKELSVFKLIEALDRVLKALEPKFQHEVVRDRLSLSDAIHRVAAKLGGGVTIEFSALFDGARNRSQVIITFLALLEMAKLRLVRVSMNETQQILITARGDALAAYAPKSDEELEREYQ